MDTEPLYESEVFIMYHDERGFVEFVVKEGQELNKEDFPSLKEILGVDPDSLPSLKVLVNRKNDYSTGASMLLPPFPKLDVDVGRLAYLVYSPQTAKIAKFVGDVALPEVPHEVFQDRNAAVEWLLKQP